MGYILEKWTTHSFCLTVKLCCMPLDTWSIRITGTAMHKISYKSMKCHYLVLRLVCFMLWVQQGLLDPFSSFWGHKCTLTCYTYSDTIFEHLSCYKNASSQQEHAEAHIENSSGSYFNIVDNTHHVL